MKLNQKITKLFIGETILYLMKNEKLKIDMNAEIMEQKLEIEIFINTILFLKSIFS